MKRETSKEDVLRLSPLQELAQIQSSALTILKKKLLVRSPKKCLANEKDFIVCFILCIFKTQLVVRIMNW